MALLLRAPAKLNLHLRVVARRPDGYHELETVFHALELCDDLVAERVEAGVGLTLLAEPRRGLPVAAGADNLVCRAGRAFLDALGPSRAAGGIHYWLQKRIPAGGGLGGGSSDAAAALLLANELYGNALTRDALLGIAVRLGADVPFFVAGGGTRLGRGIGEDLTPIEGMPSRHFVLIVPPFGTSTAEVFKNLPAQLIGEGPHSTIGPFEAPLLQGIAQGRGVRNDLERTAMTCYPELAVIRDRVVASGYPDVRMSGSGSTLFLAFESAARAARAQDELAALAAAARVDILSTRSAKAAVAAMEVVSPPGESRGVGGATE